MPHSFGYRSQTRKTFQQAFRHKGAIRMTKYLTTFKIGQYVDIKVDGSQQKGMPHKTYHGRTGRVFNINPRSIGVIIQKQVREKYQEKRIHVRKEHLQISQSR